MDSENSNVAFNAAYLGIIHSEHGGGVTLKELEMLGNMAVDYSDLEDQGMFDYEVKTFDDTILEFYLNNRKDYRHGI